MILIFAFLGVLNSTFMWRHIHDKKWVNAGISAIGVMAAAYGLQMELL